MSSIHMSALARQICQQPFATPQRRQAAILLLVALIIARSAPLSHANVIAEKVSLKQWRDERRIRKEEKRKRAMETPL